MKANTIRVVWGAFAVLSLIGCGDDTHVHYEFRSHNGQGHGRVVVVVTDSPSDEVCSLYLTVRGVEIIDDLGRAEEVYRSASGQRIDFLSLRGDGGARRWEPIASRDGVAAGRYARVRLRLEDPEMVLATGEVVPRPDLRLADGGLVEAPLALTLRAGETRVLALDLDVARSLPLERDRDGSWTLRPALSADSPRPDSMLPGRLDLSGTVTAASGGLDVLSIDLDGARSALDALVHPAAVLLAPEPTAPDVSVLSPGDPVTLRGALGGDGRLEATLVLRGDSERLCGTLSLEAKDGAGRLLAWIQPRRGEAAAPAALRVDPASVVILTAHGEPADLAGAASGRAVSVLALREHDGKSLRAAVIDIEAVDGGLCP
jgi:hypothetical protein